MSWFLGAFKKYTVFAGRARRTEFWMYTLFAVLFSIVASILDAIIGTVFVFTGLYSLAIIIPTISVTVRRLHDIGKSGAWYFISLVPLIGGIWMLILMCTEGASGENQYGPDPKLAA